MTSSPPFASESSALGWHVVDVESGDYIDPSPQVTVQRLAARPCKRLRAQIPALQTLPIPGSFESLTPLVDYLEDALERTPGKFVLLFDEFDELPRELYARDDVGNAFFLTLRSLTSRPRIACVLVGGEKMRFILDSQGDKLNKWTVVGVDYFDRDADWAAVRATARETERNAFQHSWDDGLADVGAAAAERSNRRHRVLIALADKLGAERPCSVGVLKKHPLVVGIDLDSELREFVTRKVLKGDVSLGLYDFKVPLFFSWLRSRGIEQMIANIDVPDESLAGRKREEELRVRPEETLELAGQWGSYRGHVITEARIQAWLEQFPSAADQRLMLRLLQNVEFFPSTFVRRKLGEIAEVVRRSATARIGARPLTNRELVVSYLDGAAKSGAHFARLYADEAGLERPTYWSAARRARVSSQTKRSGRFF